jgi:beta-lactamase superfamily II metal-dependent hydrolase
MLRNSPLVAVLLLLAVPLGCTHSQGPSGPAAPGKPLEVYWVDVEGGAATLIVTPAGESVLIDAGFPGERDAVRIFKVATDVARLRRIDHLVTTHYHADHFGGAATLAAMMPVRHVHDNGLFKEGWEKPSKEYLAFEAEKRTVLSPGDEIQLTQRTGPQLHMRCLAARQTFVEPPPGATPNQDCAAARRQRPDYTDNANSLVLLLTFGDFRFYDGGDLTWNNELKLVCPVKLVPPVDVFQVTHHGQDTSNPPELVAALSPTVAVMNNGPRKGGKPKTMAILRNEPSIQAIYQLHRNVQPGEESANTSDELTANIPEACQGNYVKMSVAPDGRTYTISIPATGHARTFRTRSK